MDIDKLKRKLSLYNQYNDILEHLCVFDGALLLEHKKYNKSWLKKGRSWLQECRERLAQAIEDCERPTDSTKNLDCEKDQC
jgi:hypothetical protein